MRPAPSPLIALVLALMLTGCFMTEKSGADLDGPRTPAFIREHGNHLAGQPSLYLRQHAHNPLDWYPWGDEALAKARAEDKPIFLSIGYSSCHWCHVMEHEVFEDDSVAAFMNEHFVCIKVDREERPDLDAVYMDAVQAMTGRGGWPMSVFLTPELKPFFGGTYYPNEQFVQLTDQIVAAWEDRRDEIEDQAGQLARGLSERGSPNPGQRTLERGLVAAAVQNGKDAYDPTHQGFKQRQKFPTPVKWRFLLHEYRRHGDDELAGMIVRTLDAMAGGGLYDHVGGGFHRYTVDSRWTVPHFEKMLYDNGQLAGLFLEAGAVFDRPDWTAKGLDVLDFLMGEMRAPEGAFYASFDADSGGEEGTYYVWSRQEIIAAVGKADGPLLADLLGVSERGNFEHSGSSVLTWRADLEEVAQQHGRTTGDLAGLLEKHRATLRRIRDERTPPGLDPKVVVSWNGLVLESLAQATALTGRPEYLAAAEQAASFLLETHRRDDGSLWRTSVDGATSGDGILDDYAFFAAALLEMHQVSGDERWLREARELVDHARAGFARPDGGWFLSAADVIAPLGRTVEYFDSVEPSGNAVMFNVMIDLAALTGHVEYHREATEGLASWGGLLEKGGVEVAWWFEAAGKLLWPYFDVVIAGEPGTGDTTALREAYLRRMPAGAVLSTIPAAGAAKSQLALAPALAGKTALEGKATAYVCEFGTCQAPTTDSQKMLEQILVGWEH